MRVITLRAKFLYGLLVLMIFFGAVSITFIQTTLHDRLSAELQKRGISIAKHFAEVAANPFLTETTVSIEMLAEDYLKREEDLVYVYAVNNHGEVVAHTFGRDFPVELLSVNRLQPQESYSIKALLTEKGRILDIAAPILQGELGVVHVGVSVSSIDQGVANVIGLSTWIMLGMLAVGCLYIYFFTTAITRPVEELIKGVEAVGGGDLDRRIPVSTRDEIGQLATSFNTMTENLKTTTVSKDYMDQLINTMNDALVVLSPDNRIKSCNRAFRDLVGLGDREVVGARGSEFFGGEGPINDRSVAILAAEGFISGMESSLRTKAGMRIPVLTSMAAMFDDAHNVQDVICAAQDITSLKKAEEALQMKQRELEDLNRNLETVVRHRTVELARANEELLGEIVERRRAEDELRSAKELAEIANHAKTEFLANMSHEIRTPLNAIMGMADLMSESELSQEQQGYLQVLHRSGTNLLQLINDILDLSKIESGVMEIESVEFDLEELLDRVCEMLALRAHEKGLELVCDLAQDVPVILLGDPNRLRQVLVNLIGNAVKFTHHGNVLLRVEALKTDHETAELRFSVRDTGMGIPAEKISAIFEIFAQADSSMTRKYGGSGLGLAICRRLVRLMGGEIEVTSRQGYGSEFTFVLGFRRQMPAQPDVRRVNLQNVRVLVVDDIEMSRHAVSEMLRRHGAVVTVTGSGEDALAETRKASCAGNPFRLMLVDSRMPGVEIDGFELVRRIRDDQEVAFPSGSVIMMLTSDNRASDIVRVVELGIVAYLVKPVKRTDLLHSLDKVLCDSVPARQMPLLLPMVTPQAEAEGHRILLVEDTADNRMLIKAFLRNSGYVADEAENGAVAVEKFRSNLYALVLMDMQMPVMDGYSATREIRRIEVEDGRTAVPIIALTAYAFEEDAKRTAAAGCDFHLPKPVKKGELLQCMDRYVRGGQAPDEKDA